MIIKKSLELFFPTRSCKFCEGTSRVQEFSWLRKWLQQVIFQSCWAERKKKIQGATVAIPSATSHDHHHASMHTHSSPRNKEVMDCSVRTTLMLLHPPPFSRLPAADYEQLNATAAASTASTAVAAEEDHNFLTDSFNNSCQYAPLDLWEKTKRRSDLLHFHVRPCVVWTQLPKVMGPVPLPHTHACTHRRWKAVWQTIETQRKSAGERKEKLLWLRPCGFRLLALCLYQEEHLCETPWQQIINEAPWIRWLTRAATRTVPRCMHSHTLHDNTNTNTWGQQTAWRITKIK